MTREKRHGRQHRGLESEQTGSADPGEDARRA
jgi:hypothetical protein